jgi:hypothetical protein
MAKSRFEYVKLFEEDPKLLPAAYIVIRVDGRGFHKYALALQVPVLSIRNSLACSIAVHLGSQICTTTPNPTIREASN